MIMVQQKIAPILAMFPTSREALNFPCNENEPYHEGLSSLIATQSICAINEQKNIK